MKKTTHEIVQEIINLQLGREATTEISLTSNLADDLNADSLDAVEIIMEVEDAFEIEIPDEIAEKIETLEDILEHLDEIL
ncbi:MAG: acyl carrier protein [Bacillota bacterium]|nr:acyl carrier protein [Bacillota bacterium]